MVSHAKHSVFCVFCCVLFAFVLRLLCVCFAFCLRLRLRRRGRHPPKTQKKHKQSATRGCPLIRDTKPGRKKNAKNNAKTIHWGPLLCGSNDLIMLNPEHASCARCRTACHVENGDGRATRFELRSLMVFAPFGIAICKRYLVAFLNPKP